MEAGIPCVIPFGTACSHYPPGAERLSERDVTGYTTVCVPVQLRDLRVQLERRDTPSVSGDRSARAGVTPALHSGLHTPAGTERYPSYGQPQVDRDSRALYDHVAALEQFQRAGFTELQQELRYQKAQVAQTAQTASNIQVELGSQVVRLHDRVAALEKLAYAASSSSASHQG
ncbi:hypothetical protein PC116_g20312 [Phytophthora cactorum]|nr:hypothetical protein PC112_g21058 [Phytophthora cactorum]KAG4231416.1 hypothetical protein PC116_g20312 [Phytophthora cactorum]